MRATELFLYSNLARVNERLANSDDASSYYARAFSVGIDILSRPFENGVEAGKTLHDFAKFCSTNALTDEATSATEKVDAAMLCAGPDAAHKQALQISRARFRYVTGGREVMQAEFQDSIAAAEAEFGVRSNAVQELYAGYAQVLVDFGFIEEAVAVMRERMLHLDYWYENYLIFDPPKSETEDPKRVARQVKKFNQSEQRNRRKIEAGEALASAAYQAGDHETAFQKYLVLANLGHLYSQFMIGTLYQCGIGTEINMEKAREYYLYASRRGHMIAPHYYGALLQMGLGGPVDLPAATYWYSKAANKEYLPAFDNLFSGVKGGYCSSIEIRLRAAIAGHATAITIALDLFREPVQHLIRI